MKTIFVKTKRIRECSTYGAIEIRDKILKKYKDQNVLVEIKLLD